MANELFLVIKETEFLLDPTVRPIELSGSTFDEPGLRTWMSTTYQIAPGLPLKTAFTVLRAFGWMVLMIFPTDDLTVEAAADIRQKREEFLGRKT